MTVDLLDLWPEIDTPRALSPKKILQMQVDAIAEKTSDILQAEVVTSQQPNSIKGRQDNVMHRLDLIAPALDSYRKTVFEAWHSPDELYPVFVRYSHPSEHAPKVAHDPNEFIEILKSALNSSAVRSTINSLIARSNEALEVVPA